VVMNEASAVAVLRLEMLVAPASLPSCQAAGKASQKGSADTRRCRGWSFERCEALAKIWFEHRP
jgi:hypothetical protein